MPTTLRNTDILMNSGASVGDPAGTAPCSFARAWVNFNGTGTVAIRNSGNVTSITDNGTGDYTVNFTTAMPDENYAMIGISSNSGNTANFILGLSQVASPQIAGSVRIITKNNSAVLNDVTNNQLAIFR
jgi:hypothetical protein